MTTAAKEFWKSPAAQHFPHSLEIHGEQWPITEQADYYKKTYKKLVASQWIPSKGEILELGAGASSGLLFPQEVIQTRLTATDISPLLLSQNPVPAEYKCILDAGNDPYPASWHQRFDLVLAMHLSRYLDVNEKIHLAQQTQHLLAPEGRILLLDTTQTPNRDVAALIGEVGPFVTEQECAILEGIGYTDIEYGSYFVTFFDRFGERTGTHIDYVTAMRSNSYYAEGATD